MLTTLFDAQVVVPDGTRSVKIEGVGQTNVVLLMLSAVTGRGFLTNLQAGAR